MVTIASVDSTILVSLMYTRADNFTGQVLYKDLNTAYLHPKAAAALHKAQQILRRSHPGLTLKVYDAARRCRYSNVCGMSWPELRKTST